MPDAVIGSLTDVPMPSGAMDAFVAHPENGISFPAVLVMMDIWGLRQELFDIARKIATAGYYCIVPNFYYRQGKVRFEVRDERGRMKSFAAISQAERDRILRQMHLLTDEMAIEDAGALLRHLRSQPVADRPKGAIGYCLGGRFVFQAAASYPDEIRAIASLHGTRLVSEAALSPHRLADKCRGEIYCAFAEHDEFAAPDIRAAMDQAYAGRGNVRYQPVLHANAAHGYALPDRDVFDQAAADHDWDNIFAMLRRMLGPG